MNYKLIYDNLILKARTRELEEGIYFEKHHVVPKCLGGGDDRENLVKLTAEEHYVAHQLLVKIYPGNVSLIYAANTMATDPYGNRSNNKHFGWLKRKQSELMTGRKRSPEFCEKMRIANLGKKYGEETLKKRSEALKGRVFTEEHRENLSKALKGRDFPHNNKEGFITAGRASAYTPEANAKRSASMKGRKRTTEHQAKLNEAQKGRVMSEETRAKISASKKGKKLGPRKSKELQNSL